MMSQQEQLPGRLGFKMDDKEKLFILEERIKNLSSDKDSLMEIIISDVGEEKYYSGNFEHEALDTVNNLRLKINSLMIERGYLRKSLGYDIIGEEEK